MISPPAATTPSFCPPCSLLQARKAEADGADYLGAGAVYPTGTKDSGEGIHWRMAIGALCCVLCAARADAPRFQLSLQLLGRPGRRGLLPPRGQLWHFLCSVLLQRLAPRPLGCPLLLPEPRFEPPPCTTTCRSPLLSLCVPPAEVIGLERLREICAAVSIPGGGRASLFNAAEESACPAGERPIGCCRSRAQPCAGDATACLLPWAQPSPAGPS